MTPTHRLLLSSLFLLAAGSLRAQISRIAAPMDPAKIVPMSGNLRPATLRRNDQGRVDPGFPLLGMTLYLKPSATQHADLLRLLDQQQDPASPLYHQWLTPGEYADRFGLGAQDIAAVADWLRSRGFIVGKAARSRTWIAFSGTARQVEDTFHTEIHRYVLNGKTHFANALEPSIPLALASAVFGLDGLDDLTPEQPEATSASGAHTLAPDDLAVIYDINSVYQMGIDGTGQKIVVVGASDFNAAALADVAQFRTRFNLPAMVPQVIRDTTYPDPGISNSLSEAHLDIEWVGAIARKAQIVFVYSNSFSHAVTYAIDNNLAPVINMSGNAGCEADNTPADVAFYQGLAQQGNAQGITWVISGGDEASAACESNGANLPAVSGLAVRFPASIPEVTAVGGLEFDEAAGAGPFWSTTNTANGASALSYIPEMVWNDALALQALWGGGGGQSTYFPKPAWQTGPGVPNDQARDLPDVALAASFSHDGYIVINNQSAGTAGGTSASAPVFAGIVTLLNQYVVSKGIQSTPGLGNINPNLYRLAAAGNSPFHDITLGNNIIPCGVGTLDCPNGTMGFSAASGYDLASGLGSVDVARFLNVWTNQPVVASVVSFSPPVATAGGPAFTLTVNGIGFASGAMVQWNGTPLATSFVDSTQVTTVVPANLIASPVSITITVVTSGAATSGALFPVAAAGQPAPVSATPSSGSGASQNLAFEFSDSTGYQSLGVVNILINNFLDGRNACYLAYVVSSNTLVLVDDHGDAGGSYAGAVVLGSANTIQNSQCIVGLASAVTSGTTLTLNLNITFKPAFGGNRILYMAARDQGAGNSNWQALGVWQAPLTPPGTIAVTSVFPGRGAGPSNGGQEFIFAFADTKGAGDFGVVDVLINQFIDGRQGCYLAFVSSTKALILIDDAGDAAGPYAGSMVIGSGSGSIQNSQCMVSSAGSAVNSGVNALVLTLYITFKPVFSGNRVIYAAGRDAAGGNDTDWQALATWTVQ